MQKVNEQRKNWSENFTQFFNNPILDNFSALLLNHTGEHDELDFKREWSNFPKIGKHILAIANSGGGCILFGIENESHKPIGIDSFEDEADLSSKIRKFTPAQLKFKLHSFVYESDESNDLRGKKFQALIIEDAPEYIPFVSKKNSGSDIQESIVYVRRNTCSVPSNYEEMQEIINRRIDTNASTRNELALERHYRELRQLYEQLPKPYSTEAMLEKVANQAYGSSSLFGKQRNFTDSIKDFIDIKERLIKETIFKH